MVKTKKMNLELSISRNFNKVTLTLLDEEITYDGETELLEKCIRDRFSFLRKEVEHQFDTMTVKK